MILMNVANHSEIEVEGEARFYEIGDIVGAEILEDQEESEEWELKCRQSPDCECAECQDLED